MHITNALSGGRYRKQLRRALPLYMTLALLFLLYTQIDHFGRIQHTSGKVLKRILAYQSAYQASFRANNSKFPKKIWQTWKVDPLKFEERDSARAKSWPGKNPGYRWEVLTDANSLDYVETNFGPDGENRMDIVQTYRDLNATIIKADLLRYLVMYLEGGVYADIDVENIRPVNKWIPPQFDEKDVDLVISVEIDEPKFRDHKILGPKSESFCQWTFMAKPRLPAMMRMINHVLHWLNEISQRQNVPISEVKLNFDDVLSGTGPSSFTTVMLSEMAVQTHQKLHWDTFHNLTEPILVGNILVLTVFAFAAGQGHSNSGNHENPNALVRHHYHASGWPTRHPRYSHPAYGMVEECNWKPDCVEAWNNNTAFWDLLSEDEQKKRIKAHEEVGRLRFEKEQAEERKHKAEDKDREESELLSKCEKVFFPEEVKDGAKQTLSPHQRELIDKAATAVQKAAAVETPPPAPPSNPGEQKDQPQNQNPDAKQEEQKDQAQKPESDAAKKEEPKDASPPAEQFFGPPSEQKPADQAPPPPPPTSASSQTQAQTPATTPAPDAAAPTPTDEGDVAHHEFLLKSKRPATDP